MGFQAGDLEAAKQDLQQINTQIANLHMDEQQTQQFVAMQEEIRRQMSSENGGFTATNEQEYLALTKVKLEQDVEEITKLVQENNGEVTVTQSARVEQEPVAVKKEEPGVLTKVANFFRNLFKKKKPPFPKPSKRQQEAIIKREQEKRALYRSEEENAMELSLELRQMNPKPAQVELIQQNYEEYLNLYRQSGWEMSKSPLSKYSNPEERESVMTTQMQAFFRELHNGRCFAEENIKDGQFPLNIAHLSQEDFRFILTHPNEEGVLRVIEPVMEFDIEKMMEEYPVHTLKTTEEMADMIRDFHIKYGGVLIGRVQWADKFGKVKMSPELKKRFSAQTVKFLKFTEYIYSPLQMHSPTGMYDALKADVSLLDAKLEHEEELLAMHETVAQEVKVTVDASNAEEMVEKLESGRMVTREGRPRLFGSEPIDQLLLYGEEDLRYYKELSDIGEQLTSPGAHFLDTVSDKRAAEIRTLAAQFKALFEAIDGQFQNLAQSSYDVRLTLEIGFGEPAGHLKKQFSQMK